jgi:hypothetical protein
MGYHEIRVAASKRTLRIGPTAGDVYEVDGLGQDDGHDLGPDTAFRVLFQLGQGFMIHLYVVGMAHPGAPHGFHSFWIKDCAVAHVDPEEVGPPAHVVATALDFPSVYGTVTVGDETFTVDRLIFDARPSAAQTPDHEVAWTLRDTNGVAATLRYASRGGWSLARADTRRALAAAETVRFGDPG